MSPSINCLAQKKLLRIRENDGKPFSNNRGKTKERDISGRQPIEWQTIGIL